MNYSTFTSYYTSDYNVSNFFLYLESNGGMSFQQESHDYVTFKNVISILLSNATDIDVSANLFFRIKPSTSLRRNIKLIFSRNGNSTKNAKINIALT